MPVPREIGERRFPAVGRAPVCLVRLASPRE